jgi:hypothetical protein
MSGGYIHNPGDQTAILAALTDIDTCCSGVQDDLDNKVDGLGALAATLTSIGLYLATIEAAIEAVDTVVDGIQTEVDNLDGEAMRGTDSATLQATWTDAMATALANYTAVRAAYLDQLDFNLQEAIAALPTAAEIQTEMEEDGASILDTLQDRLTAARAGYLDELAAANLPTDIANIDAIARGIDFGDMVYYENGAATGTDYPLGTPTNPVGSLPNAKTIADALNLHTIHIHGTVTLTETMEHYSFIGDRHESATDVFDLNGQDVDGCYFDGLVITGAQGGSEFINMQNCIAYSLTGMNGLITDTAFYGSTCGFADGAYIELQNCFSIYSPMTVTVQAPTQASLKNWKGDVILTAQDGGELRVRGYSGTLAIDAMTGGTCDIYCDTADITINADCTGGTINIYGTGMMTDNSGGTTVNDYLIETILIDTIDSKLDTLDGLVDAITPAGPTKDEMDTAHALLATEAKQDIIDTNVDQIEVLVDSKVAGRLQMHIYQTDLDSCTVNTYATETAVTEDVIIEGLVAYCHSDMTAEASFTGFSIQTDADTPFEFISQADGAVANMGAESQITWTGHMLLKQGTYLTFTTYGGTVSSSTWPWDWHITFRAVADGGYIA